MIGAYISRNIVRRMGSVARMWLESLVRKIFGVFGYRYRYLIIDYLVATASP